MTRAAVCADIGSTYTKAALVDLDTGALLATASHRTTVDTDVLDGLDAVRAALALQAASAQDAEVLVCSSAGGGLRLAVVGYERAVTAEAGHRVGLSAGARVVHVAAGRLDGRGLDALLAVRPDVVLLVGGTDGGNAEVLEHNAARLARSVLRCPVVVAGNVDVRAAVVAVLVGAGKTALPAPNVLPRIGVLEPQPAREAIRDVFIQHVIGGKGMSLRGAELASLVRAATPDVVLAGVELLADGAGATQEAGGGAGGDGGRDPADARDGLANGEALVDRRGSVAELAGVGDVLVLDVGGATTDVYSVVTPDPEEAALRREVVEVAWRGRTVEGDLGMRWNALGVVESAIAERLVRPAEVADLQAAAAVRAADPGHLAPATDPIDERLAALAATIACRRHARPDVVSTGPDEVVRRGGRDLRSVRLVVGSGGVLRHADPDAAVRVLRAVAGDLAGGWKLPERPALVVDTSSVLAAAGLLAISGRREIGARLLHDHLPAGH